MSSLKSYPDAEKENGAGYKDINEKKNGNNDAGNDDNNSNEVFTGELF
jgi:hypothetical protein